MHDTIISFETIDEISQKLIKEFEPEQIILFGSFASGNVSKDSDIDLLVIVSESKERPIARMQRALFCLKGYESIAKDILVKTHREAYHFKNVIGSLTYNIFKEGKTLYSGTKA